MDSKFIELSMPPENDAPSLAIVMKVDEIVALHDSRFKLRNPRYPGQTTVYCKGTRDSFQVEESKEEILKAMGVTDTIKISKDQ
jgi:hypothetical protein